MNIKKHFYKKAREIARLKKEVDYLKEQKLYNGWYNYETWLVNIWFMNDPQSENIVIDLVMDSIIETKTYNSSIYQLSVYLKDLIEDSDPLIEDSTMYSDLLSSAIFEVNFYDIAEHYMEDYADIAIGKTA